MNLTLAALRAVAPRTAEARLIEVMPTLAAAMEQFGVTTVIRAQPFLAQWAWESGGFVYLREKASGDAYEGNAHLGNTEPGDGPRFKGWAWPQVTGRKNTRLASLALFGDERLVDDPSLIDPPTIELASRVSGWFWKVGAGLNLSKAAHAHGIQDDCDLNDLADAGDYLGITLAINGGTNGLEGRQALLAAAQRVDDWGEA